MKKFSIVLFALMWFSVSLFGEGNIEIPKEIGSVDSAVYTTDRKTLYTLKNETVTIWGVKPLKKLDSFVTTVNHLRKYVSEDIDMSYLEKNTKEKQPKLILSKKEDILYVFSRYIEEHWNLQEKVLTYGHAKCSNMFQPKEKIILDLSSKAVEYTYGLKKNRTGIRKKVLAIKFYINEKLTFDIFTNPLFKWGSKRRQDYVSRMPLLKLNAFLLDYNIDRLKYTMDFEDGTEETFKKKVIIKDDSTTYTVIQEIVYLQHFKKDDFEKVWLSKTIPNAISNIYPTVSDSEISLATCNQASEKHISFSIIEIERQFDQKLKSFSILAKEEKYPALFIMNTNGLNTTKNMSLSLSITRWHLNHGVTVPIHFTTVWQSKTDQMHKCNTFMPAYPNDY